MYVDFYIWLLEYYNYDELKTISAIFLYCMFILLIGLIVELIKLKKEEV